MPTDFGSSPEMILGTTDHLGTLVYSSFNQLTRLPVREHFTEMYLYTRTSAQCPPKYKNLTCLNSRTHNQPSWHWLCCMKVRSTVIFTLQIIFYQIFMRVNLHMHLLLAESLTKLQLCKWKKWQTMTSFRSQFNLYIPFAFNFTFNIKKAKIRDCTTRTMSHKMVG
jgi:hypothetical protein